jgi:hypothetical protein
VPKSTNVVIMSNKEREIASAWYPTTRVLQVIEEDELDVDFDENGPVLVLRFSVQIRLSKTQIVGVESYDWFDRQDGPYTWQHGADVWTDVTQNCPGFPTWAEYFEWRKTQPHYLRL